MPDCPTPCKGLIELERKYKELNLRATDLALKVEGSTAQNKSATWLTCLAMFLGCLAGLTLVRWLLN